MGILIGLLFFILAQSDLNTLCKNNNYPADDKPFVFIADLKKCSIYNADSDGGLDNYQRCFPLPYIFEVYTIVHIDGLIADGSDLSSDALPLTGGFATYIYDDIKCDSKQPPTNTDLSISRGNATHLKASGSGGSFYSEAKGNFTFIQTLQTPFSRSVMLEHMAYGGALAVLSTKTPSATCDITDSAFYYCTAHYAGGGGALYFEIKG
jgi:hypothetical protein